MWQRTEVPAVALRTSYARSARNSGANSSWGVLTIRAAEMISRSRVTISGEATVGLPASPDSVVAGDWYCVLCCIQPPVVVKKQEAILESTSVQENGVCA